MDRLGRFGLAVAVGLAAGAVAYYGALGLDPGTAWYAASLAAPIWAASAWATVVGYERGVLGRAPNGDAALGAKVGGLSGGFAALGVSGVLGFVTAVSSLRLGLVAAFLVFGYGLGSLSLGMLVTTYRDEWRGGSGPEPARGAAPGDD